MGNLAVEYSYSKIWRDLRTLYEPDNENSLIPIPNFRYNGKLRIPGFPSFTSRYEYCIEAVAREIERAKEDSEPNALDIKTFDSLKAEYESFRTEYDGFVHGFRIFSATLCSELKEAWQDGRIKTAKVLKL